MTDMPERIFAYSPFGNACDCYLEPDEQATMYIRADVAAADARKLRDALDSFPDHGNKTEWWNDVGQPALSEFNAKHGT